MNSIVNYKHTVELNYTKPYRFNSIIQLGVNYSRNNYIKYKGLRIYKVE
jgi:hypothetical protein